MAHILVVDDELLMHQLLRILLEPLGHRVSTRSNGPAALELAQADPPNLIICDLMMPDMSGVEVLTALKADPVLAGIPVIVLTAAPSGKLVDDANAAGAYKCVLKPFARAELLRYVTDALANLP